MNKTSWNTAWYNIYELKNEIDLSILLTDDVWMRVWMGTTNKIPEDGVGVVWREVHDLD